MKNSRFAWPLVKHITRRVNRRSVAAVLLLTSALATADDFDQRQTVTLTSAQRAHVLGEMRAMLSGTQAILSALAADDMSTVAQQARLLGKKMGSKAEDSLHSVLPKEFMHLGMSVHQDFDRIAADAETLKDSIHTLQQVSTTLNTCNVCHDAYQLVPGSNQNDKQAQHREMKRENMQRREHAPVQN